MVMQSIARPELFILDAYDCSKIALKQLALVRLLTIVGHFDGAAAGRQFTYSPVIQMKPCLTNTAAHHSK